MLGSMPTTRWGVWFVSEWRARQLGVVVSPDGLVALDVARVKYFGALRGEREAAPGGTLIAVRAGAPVPVARAAARGEFFSPKVRYPTRENGLKASRSIRA